MNTPQPLPHAGRQPAPRDALLVEELLDAIPDPIIGSDADGTVVYWSRAASEVYGYSAAEALGRGAISLLRTQVPLPVLEIMEELSDVGEWQGRLVQVDSSGREREVESRWVARRNEAGEVAGVFRIERELAAVERRRPRGPDDVERATAADELSRVARLESLGQLAGGVAHDFNNALAIIINYAAFVSGALDRLRPAPAPSQVSAVRSDLMEIQTAAERAADLTHQLLAFSRQRLGVPVPLSVNAAIGEIEPLLRHTVGEHIVVTTELAEGLELVRSDPAQLQQVLVNLASNARDAMPSGGTLSIDTANVTLDRDSAAAAGPELEAGRYVRLRLSDTGTGMEPRVLRHAFDPFFTTKPIGYGNGLGLSSVYGIITQAGGHARFYSEPGLGTTFVALLPAHLAPNSPRPARADRAAAREPTGRTILLVEDERALRDVTRRILVAAGYDVIEAASGEQAIAAAAAHDGTIDALLTDIVMPGMLGHELAGRLGDRLPGLRVLYMSGFSEWLVGRTAPIERDALVEKPFTAPTLLDQLAAVLAGSDQRQP